jgi:hypothetical protein
LELMARFAGTSGLALILCVGGYLPARSSSAVPGGSATSCGTGPIASVQEAERHAACYFRTISESCDTHTGSFHIDAVRKGDTWEVRSEAPASSCKTWLVIFSAADGRVSTFEPVQ